MVADHEEHILSSWQKNSSAWTNAIKEGSIASRKLATNKAIVDTITSLKPSTMLDIGCGEGWLCREAHNYGVRTVGVDAIDTLIRAANEIGPGTFHVYSYQQIISGDTSLTGPFDLVVFNFSIFGNELVVELLKSVKRFLSENGSLVIQTLHPVVATGELTYVDGWREGSWTGFSSDFTDPHAWYFRTLNSWINLLRDTGYTLKELKEPLNPTTNKPASVIFVCNPAK